MFALNSTHKLTQAEERQRQLMQAWTAKKDEVPVAVQMIKDVHQLVSTTLGDIGVPLATLYVSDTVKYMLALCAYQNNTGPMPRVVVDESSSSGQGTSSQVYETMLPPGDFPRPNPPPSAPATVKTECEEVFFPVKNGGQSHPNYIISENVNF
ncbi:hypothetical protein E2C01_056135 [Portunus trituberculatus]|uniref:Uncharacterized protein n=1 Tax=Portunus trituberculatus TaxID=210409 RepID=A0A5B7GXC6_PORTR|nr:hypothetical protein [Portunus trituberculatus]